MSIPRLSEEMNLNGKVSKLSKKWSFGPNFTGSMKGFLKSRVYSLQTWWFNCFSEWDAPNDAGLQHNFEKSFLLKLCSFYQVYKDNKPDQAAVTSHKAVGQTCNH